MNVIVCIKQVPDTNEVKINPVTGTLIRDGVPSIINPDDKSALEAALRLKDEYGVKVTVLTMGPPQADLVLKEAYAMGADELVLLTDRAFAGSDTLSTSTILAAAIKTMDYDIIMTGRQAIDGDTAQVGPQISEHLGIPVISYAEEIKLENDSIIVKRQYEDRYQMLKGKLPLVITALSELNTPRYMNVGRIFDAYKEKEVKVLSISDIGLDPATIGLKGSPTSVKKSFTKGVKPAGVVHKDLDPSEAAKVLVEKFKEKFII